jgi:hypothetical protein
MCVVSMIGDHYNDKWSNTNPFKTNNTWIDMSNVSRAEFEILKYQFQAMSEEFNKLKNEVLEMKALLLRAKEYDERNNEPHCEMEEKVAVLKKVAELVGVDLSEIFGK